MSFLILADGQVSIPKHFPTILLSRLMKKVSWGPKPLYALATAPFLSMRIGKV